jgi:putative nucleotidyltransferase with HDIG domain
VEWAESVARARLADALPRRWAHVQAVAAVAARLAEQLGDDEDTLVTSAWLHDVGYAPELAVTGFHPLDGARFLREGGAPVRVLNLVAFHSAAATEADELGLSAELAEFDDERSLTRDLLWFADMTTGPDGQCMGFAERMAEVRQRYDADHYVNRALEVGLDERGAAVSRARSWIEEVGLVGQV